MRLLAPAALLTLVALTACAPTSAGTAPPSAAATSTPKPHAFASATPPPEPTASASAAPPAACLAYDQSPPLPNAEGSAPLLDAIAATTLPPGVVLTPGVQVITSTESGKLDAVVRICSEPLGPDGLVDVGNQIAAAVYASDARDLLSRLVISPLVPDGDAIVQDPATRPRSTDYAAHSWDPATGPHDGNWE